MKNWFIYMVLTGITCLLPGCSHEIPGKDTPVDIYITGLELHTSFAAFELNDFNTRANGDYLLRFSIDIYQKGNSQPARREIVTLPEDPSGTYSISKPIPMTAGKYEIVVWADYVQPGTACDWFYNTTLLTSVTPNGTYCGSDERKAAYFGSTSVELVDRPVDINLVLEPPFAKYQIIATDLAQYISKTRSKSKAGSTEGDELKGMHVKVMYQNFFPTGFNARSGKPNDADTGISFMADVEQLSGNELRLASDFVWVENTSSVDAVIIVYDADNNVVAQTSAIHIPYERMKLTTIRGSFLQTNSGIGIDPNFDGEYNIVIPD